MKGSSKSDEEISDGRVIQSWFLSPHFARDTRSGRVGDDDDEDNNGKRRREEKKN